MHMEEQRKDESRKQQKKEKQNKVGLFTKWNIFKNGGFEITLFFIKR